MTNGRARLIGCGVLQREIEWLVRKNHWALDMEFLDASLHIDCGELGRVLSAALDRGRGRPAVVAYGVCCPGIDCLIHEAQACRVTGQNCVEMLLGEDDFAAELANGAFFLLEGWARRWEEITTKTFGEHWNVIREIFQEDRKYILCLVTPCSAGFRAEASAAGRAVGLPVRWRTVALDHFESVLTEALRRLAEATPWPK